MGLTNLPAQDPPNVVLIIADDLGWGDVGYLGSKLHTPNIDKLAEEGLQLDRFYTAPICSPTRAGILTGRYPNRYGLRNNVVRPWLDFGLDTTEVLLPEMLAQAGYDRRGLVGKWHLGHSRKAYHPLARGFTDFYGHLNGAIDYFQHTREEQKDWFEGYAPSDDEGYTTTLITKRATRYLRQYKAAGGPFFLQVAYNAPHSPLQATHKYLDRNGFDPNKKRFLPGKAKGNTRRQTFAAMVEQMDNGIGVILQTLEELGIAENTLVIFLSDNGAETKFGGSSGELRGKKLTEWEGGIRQPALVRWPAKIKGGKKSKEVMAYVDLFPTLAALVAPNYQPARPFDGINLLPQWLKRKKNPDRLFYAGNGVLLSKYWKYVQVADATKAMGIKKDHLFRIDEDPSERVNLLVGQPDQARKMRLALDRFAAMPSSQPPPKDRRPKDFSPPPRWVSWPY